MTAPYIPTHDLSGQRIDTLSTAELRRRLATGLGGRDGGPIERQYERAYLAALAERGEGRKAES